MVDLPPAHIRSQIADGDGEDGVDAVLRAPVESEQCASFIEERNVCDDERQNLENDRMSATILPAAVLHNTLTDRFCCTRGDSLQDAARHVLLK